MSYETIEIDSENADRVHILTGTIVSTGDGVAEVNIDDYGIYPDIPVFYHCSESETADGMPFSIDDRVIIVNSGSAVSPSIANMKVVGFEDGLPRDCCVFREHWGDTLCENNDGWGFYYPISPVAKCVLPPDRSGSGWSNVTTLADGILSVAVTGNHDMRLQKEEPFVSFDADFIPKEIKIKILANAVGTTVPYQYAFVMLSLDFYTSGEKSFIFSINPAMKPGAWPIDDYAFVGDNGGEEQIIVISDHFTLTDDDKLTDIYLRCESAVSANFSLDYIEIKGKCIPW